MYFVLRFRVLIYAQKVNRLPLLINSSFHRKIMSMLADFLTARFTEYLLPADP
ncbi:MAG: hypothetical protein ACE5NJ_07945 [Thermodesulfobacteriota bacterium]